MQKQYVYELEFQLIPRGCLVYISARHWRPAILLYGESTCCMIHLGPAESRGFLYPSSNIWLVSCHPDCAESRGSAAPLRAVPELCGGAGPKAD